MISFSQFFLERQNDLKIPTKPYGFRMDRHGNFAVVNGGMGEHEDVGEQILKSLGVMKKRFWIVDNSENSNVDIQLTNVYKKL